MLWTPTDADLPRLAVTQRQAGWSSNYRSKKSLFSGLYLDYGEPADGRLQYESCMSALNPPSELQEPLVKTGVTGLAFVAAPGQPDDENVGERSIEKDLDIAVSFVSSVEDTEKENPDPNNSDPITVRERKTRATLDMRLNPFGTRSRIDIIHTPGSQGWRVRAQPRVIKRGFRCLSTRKYLRVKLRQTRFR